MATYHELPDYPPQKIKHFSMILLKCHFDENWFDTLQHQCDADCAPIKKNVKI